MITIAKKFTNYPAGHRQHTHKGHCRYIHGHDWSFKLIFVAHHRDENGFIIDFGQMQPIKDFMAHMFDHTLLICEDDPELRMFKELHEEGIVDLRVLKGVSAEYIAEYVLEESSRIVYQMTGGRAWVAGVECWEDEKNSALAFKEQNGPRC